MGVAFAQFLVPMGREIDDRDLAAGPQDPRGLGDGERGVLREMQHLMEQDSVETRIVEGQLCEITLHQLDALGRKMLQFGTRDA